MATYTQIIYQLIFSTKNHDKTLIEINHNELYAYLYGVLSNNNCHVYRINGVENHIHIVTHIHPTKCLSSIMKDLNVSSSLYFIKLLSEDLG